jgi:hypothetical protein
MVDDALMTKRNLAHDIIDEFKEWAVSEANATTNLVWLGETARHARVDTANERVLDEIIIHYTDLVDDAMIAKLSQNNG